MVFNGFTHRLEAGAAVNLGFTVPWRPGYEGEAQRPKSEKFCTFGLTGAAKAHNLP
jgi:hypothetical protein